MARSFGSKGRILASMLGIAVVLGMTLAQSPPPAPIMPAPVVPGTPSAFPLAIPPGDASADAGAGERFINVGLAGKKHRCRLIVSWDLPNGGSAYQVQALDTKEMLTLVREAAAGSSAEETPVRIFRWGSRATPPHGAPVAPPVPAPLAIATEPATIPMPPTPGAAVVAAAPRSDDPWIVGPPAKHGEPVNESFAAQRPKPSPPTGPVIVSNVVPAVAPTATAPTATAPTATAPVATAPVATAPVATAPVVTAPVVTAPIARAPISPPAAPFVLIPPAVTAVAPAVAPTQPALTPVVPTPVAQTTPTAPLTKDRFEEWKIGNANATNPAPVAQAAPAAPAASTAPPTRVAPIVAQRVPEPQPPQPVQVAQVAPEVQPPPIERIDGVHRREPAQPSRTFAPQPPTAPIPYTPLVPEPAPGMPTQVAPLVPIQPEPAYPQVPTTNVVVTPSMVTQAPSVPATPLPEPRPPVVAAPRFPEPTAPVAQPSALVAVPMPPSLPLIINGPNLEAKAPTLQPQAPQVAAVPAPTPDLTPPVPYASTPTVQPEAPARHMPGLPQLDSATNKTKYASIGQEPAKEPMKIDPALAPTPVGEPKRTPPSLPFENPGALPIPAGPGIASAPDATKVVSVTENIVAVPCAPGGCPAGCPDLPNIPCAPGSTTIPACPSCATGDCPPGTGPCSPEDVAKIPTAPTNPALSKFAPKMPPASMQATEPKSRSWLASWNTPPAPEGYNAFTPPPAPRTGPQPNAGPAYANAWGSTPPQTPPQGPQGYPQGAPNPMMMASGMPMMPPPGMMPYGAMPYPVPYYRPMPTSYAMAPPNPAMDRQSSLRTTTVAAPAANNNIVVASSRSALDVPAQLRTLLESAHPSERETAVLNLSDVDWHVHGRIVPALNEAAVKDPAPLVRAACVAAMVRMHAPAETLQPTLDVLQNDRDIRVRHEVDVARDALSHRQ